MPVDSFWLDIGHTDSFKYFEFDPVRFSDKELEKMKQEVFASDRKIVTITDPQIGIQHNSKVFKAAMQQEKLQNKSLFIRQRNKIGIYSGMCWPGSSAYIDFINPEGR